MSKTSSLSPMIDPYGRHVTYMRLSVTDRCDFRCVYCMSEHMTFLPKKDVLSLEEIERLCAAFIKKGVRRLRITGGEPLVRRGIMTLLENLSQHLETGALDELTVTTNGTQLPKYADELYRIGVRRINISLDTRDPDKFESVTRWGKWDKVAKGLEAAKKAGLKIKINTVALKDFNETEIPDLISWAHSEGFDLTLIETMPLGEIDGDRIDQYVPLSKIRADLEQQFTLLDSPYSTGGPARYVTIEETGGRLGFITPLTHNFCESCNRVRMTSTGQLYMCLGQQDSADFRKALRSGGGEQALLDAIDEAISRKPKGHDFKIERADSPKVERHMSLTGG